MVTATTTSRTVTRRTCPAVEWNRSYLIIYDQGGVYADSDVSCLYPLDMVRVKPWHANGVMIHDAHVLTCLRLP